MTSIRKIKRLKPPTKPPIRILVGVGGIQVFGIGPTRQCANLNEARQLCEANIHSARMIRQLRRFLPTARAHQRRVNAEQRANVRSWKQWGDDRDAEGAPWRENGCYINIRPEPLEGENP